MAAIHRFRRRVLTFLVTLVGGSGVFMGPLAPEARAYERASTVKPTQQQKTNTNVNSRLHEQGVDSRLHERGVRSRLHEQSAKDATMKREIFDQQQEILLKMEELRQLMSDMQQKLDKLQQEDSSAN